jgi:hypothetical protein
MSAGPAPALEERGDRLVARTGIGPLMRGGRWLA